MNKIFFFTIFCLIFCMKVKLTEEQQPFPPPQPPLVISCFAKIVSSVDSCAAKGKLDWNVQPEDDPQSKSVCCANWDIYDCFEAAAKDGCNLTELSAFQQFYNKLSIQITSVNCSQFPFHSTECKNRPTTFPPPQPPLVISCFAKAVDSIDSCSAKAKKDWNLTPESDQRGKNVCCGNWDLYDCFELAAQDNCNLTELSSFQQYFNGLSQQITTVNCSQYKYHSKECKAETYPPPQPQLCMNCFTKIVDYVDVCTSKAQNDWKTHLGGDPKGKKICCSNWDVYDCFEAAAKDNCNLTELSSFQKYYNRMSQMITNVNCSKYQFHSQECKNGASLIWSNCIINTIALLAVYLLIKWMNNDFVYTLNSNTITSYGFY